MDGACWGLVLSPVHLRLASLLYSSVMDFCKLKASISGDHQLTEAQGHRRLLQLKVNVGDTIAMLPKSRRALTIQEIAALARSSLHGISQVVKDHVTKPTAMAQGRVAHLIEWKGWSKPSDSPAALESAFSSYSDLSEGEQEARFAAGVAEQFAIAEAKLRAWSSVDGEDSTDESYDEDFAGGTDSGEGTFHRSAASWGGTA
uniref:Family with sequence similarity 131 member A n=1 Tax=Molossus molossus TaxID=27622 RepID=A0A7J8HZQ0_MOLMO|nr:family with sequence similarity 131 member A [Molossus molossus]